MTLPRDTFATAITCIDGRVQQPISDWMKLHTNVHHVDLVTEPGPDKVLSSGPSRFSEDIIRRVRFSVRYHFSPVVAVTGHHDCAANDADKAEHFEQILDGVRVVLAENLQVRVLGLWLNEWNSVELVWDTQTKQAPTNFL
ncbi:MAG: carbonic anhydrase [Acidobacteriota bacterium]